ncbi:HAMP domain-containing protein [Mycobacterium frederiksbergense]|uniref:sensor histidine kinase n=1 Tax=Mycolicibacterium frederiksbergense TaxID=117567 RepID=UPI0021F3607A|nr:ATP-binding protein [Mycolicibacterium frederiksbergense]MCV7044509.1 HAMP domain-containing protein [Mycolicibacterium frederiksbergense]
MKIRTRLTVLYAGALFLAGVLLIGLIYFYLEQSLDHRPGAALQATIRDFAEQRGGRSFPRLDNLLTMVTNQAEQQRQALMHGMLRWSLTALVVVSVLACGAGWLLAGRALRPLQDVTATARRVAGRSLHERIALHGPDDEIKELADTFDAMLERLDRAFDSQHRFVANASHELRTPLTINRTLIEVALEDPATPDSTRRLGETLLAVNQRQERLIDGLLVLAGSDQQLQTHERVDLAEIARRALRTAQPTAQSAGIVLRISLDPCAVRGDPALLERLIGNLLDNAIRYNVEAGWVDLSVSVRDGLALLSVQNSGPAVGPAEVEGLFEPFRRLTRTATTVGGTGLGLSIVRSVANAHGGQVQASSRPDGGLIVEVTLPLTR